MALSDEDRKRISLAMGVPADAIGAFLDGVEREYGGPLSYLRGIGVTEEMFTAIRNQLLEPVG